MRTLLPLIILFIIACSSKETTKENPLLGSWKMSEIHYIYTDTTYSVKDAEMGFFMYTQNRYVIMYNPWINPRIPFENLSKPSNDEMIASFKTVVYNSGNYSLTDSTLTTTADIAKVPGFEGGVQYYRYKITGKTLDITMFDETYPSGKKPDWYGKLNVRFVLKKEE